MTQPCAGKREIKALGVKCSNMERGCELVGTVGTLEEHVATCGFTLVPCPKQCKDNNEAKHFLRKDLVRHLKNDCPNRHYECKSRKCREKGTYAYITEVHDKTCKMKILPCPNDGCDTKIQRQQVSEHISKCPHTVIPCKYKGIGCDTELKREDMAAHEQDDKLHLHMSLETVNSLQDTVTSLTSLQEESMTLDNKGSKIYILTDFHKEKDARSEITFSNMSFYSHPKGYHMTLRVYANGYGNGEGTHVTVSAPILKGKYDGMLKWPFIGNVTFTLLNQLEDKSHTASTLTFNATHDACAGGTAWGYFCFIPHSGLAHDLVKNTQYLKDDTLYFKMSVEVDDRKPWLE